MPDDTQKISSKFEIEGQLITDNRTIAENFNKCFIGTVDRLVKSLTENTMSLVSLARVNREVQI